MCARYVLGSQVGDGGEVARVEVTTSAIRISSASRATKW
jgi:hypothetical protein